MKNTFLFLTLLLLSLPSVSQNINIGDSFPQVENLIKFKIQEANRRDSHGYKQPKITYEIKLNDRGEKVIYTYQNDQIYLDLNLKSNIITKYVFEYENLSIIKTSFTSIPIENLQTSFNNKYSQREIGQRYFSEDYKYYRTITVDEGFSTIVYKMYDKENNWDDLNTIVLNKQREYIGNSKNRENRRTKRKSLLFDYFPVDDYIDNYSNDMKKQLIPLIVKLFKDDLEKSEVYNQTKKFRVLKANYTIRFYSSAKARYSKYSLIKNDSNSNYTPEFIGDLSFKISPIIETFEGREYKLNREFFVNIETDLTRGIVELKNKKGKSFETLTETKLLDEHRELIQQKIKDLKTGKYSVIYQFGKINGIDATKILIYKK